MNRKPLRIHRPHRARSIAIAVGVLALVASPAGAEETRDASARTLAAAIASEARGQPDQYLSYAKQLAALLADLTPDQQRQVMGFTTSRADDPEPAASPAPRPQKGSGTPVSVTDASAWFGAD